MKRIARHLDIDADDSLIQRVVEGSSFDSMKAAAVIAAKTGNRSNTDEHLRSGKGGKWRSHFFGEGVSDEEGERLKSLVARAFHEGMDGVGGVYNIGGGETLTAL